VNGKNRSAVMAEYRIYLLSAQDKIEGAAFNIVCDTNEDAMRHAAACLLEKGHHAEIWQGARLVGRLRSVTAA
jgi:hypothetical protein